MKKRKTALSPDEDRLVTMQYIAEHSGFTESWLHLLIKKEKFPKPMKFGRINRWWLSVYLAWLSEHEPPSKK